MNDFDEKIKTLAENISVPENYAEKIDDVLGSLPENADASYDFPKKRPRVKGFAVAAAIVIIIVLAGGMTFTSKAGILDTFKLNIMNFLGISEEEKTDYSKDNDNEVVSKPELMLEARESVVDAHGVFLLFKVTAPPDITLDDKNVTFDYYVMCEGDNYSANNLIGGATSCELIETMKEKPNVATYLFTISGDMAPYFDKNVTVFLKDLTRNPNGENPELLVGGMWSLTFFAEQTVRDKIEIEGSKELEIPFLGTTATIENIELTPLGCSVAFDVSNVPYDELNVSDLDIDIRIKMADGSEYLLMPYSEEDNYIVDASETMIDTVGEKVTMTDSFTFEDVIESERVIGFYIGNLFVPAE